MPKEKNSHKPRLRFQQFKFLVLFALLVGAFQNCGYIAAPMDPALLAAQFSSLGSSNIAFKTIQDSILTPKCVACHNSGSAAGGYSFSSYNSTKGAVSVGNADGSPLYTSVNLNRMPSGGPALSDEQKQMIRAWITSGAPETVSGGTGTTNTAPVIADLVNQTIRLPTTSTNIYSTVTDPGGLIASFQWTQISGATATLNGASTGTLVVSNLNVGTYMFRLTVIDDGGLSASKTVTITVLAAGAATPVPTPTPAPTPTPTPTPTVAATYTSVVSTIYSTRYCTACHNATSAAGGVNLATYAGSRASVVPGSAATSQLYLSVTTGTMPQGGAKLNATELELLRNWINNGAPNN